MTMVNSTLALKIISTQQMRKVDEYTVIHEPILTIDLMERASKVFTTWFVNNFDKSNSIKIFCGTGNNGGDGLAIARLLLSQDYSIQVFVIGDIKKATKDFEINHQKLNTIIQATIIDANHIFPPILPKDIVIDGLFGSGLNREITGSTGNLIQHINNASCKEVIAIDIPSGLFADIPSNGQNIIRATQIVSFQSPKLAFLLPENAKYCNRFTIKEIGLDQTFLDKLNTSLFFVNKALIKSIFKQRGNFIHKGDAGRCFIIAGSKGKIGAAILSTLACLRTGAGLVTIQVPKCGYIPLQTAVPEAMVIEDNNETNITEIHSLNKQNAIGIGPGIGTNSKTIEAFKLFLKETNFPIVLDADALNIISLEKELLKDIPSQSVLTPHPQEFKRLVGEWNNEFERLDKQIALSKEFGIIVLLKGAYSSITIPSGQVFFNSTGNSGMATAGSGDVLTGIITSLLGQGYSSEQSTILGAYLHGLSGDIYINMNSKEGLISRDLIEYIPIAIRELYSY
jgi:hydroxyethylthiazole kinase-like uncharacterized protein yjeF